MFVTFIFTGTIIILLCIYIKGKYNELYWRNRGVVFYERYKVGGLFGQFLVEDKPFYKIIGEIYHKFRDEPAVGVGSLLSPALFVIDPANINHILQADFQSFTHRGFPVNENDVLGNNMLLTHGPKWKLMRQKMSPLFSAAKLKKMYYIMDRSAQDFIDFLEKNPEKLKTDTFNTLTLFCNAAISAAVFGIGTKSSFDSPFQEMAMEALVPNFKKNVVFTIAGISDFLFKIMGLKLLGDHEEFFIDAIKQVLRKREKENVKKHDFVDLCVSLQKNGTMRDPETGLELEPTDEFMAAQAFFFFLAGVETTAAVMFALMVELGRNLNIQERVIKEVDTIFKKYNGQMNYDAIFEMEYLGKVLDESLRMHPPVGYLTRQCVRDSVLPVGNVPIEKDTKIFLPLYDLHYDPKYYPNPEVFDPDRFSRDGRAYNDAVYMPFGKGNRICIGARYGRLQLLSGMVHLLRNYTLRTVIHKGGIKYSKEQFQVRQRNVDVELIPRNL